MLARIVISAALAGLLAGLVWSGAQAMGTVRIILAAEVYEDAADAEAAVAAPTAAMQGHSAMAGMEHGHEADEWRPANGLQRALYTLLGNVLSAVGFGLMLTAVYALRGSVSWREGLLWGLAGFAAVHLATTLGLPPEVPGMQAAPLGQRQLWWLATAALTGGGLALVFLKRSVVAVAIGLGLIALPHVIGAPHLEVEGGAPDGLAREFVLVSLVTNAFFWIVLGGLSAFVFDALGRERPGRRSVVGRG